MKLNILILVFFIVILVEANLIQKLKNSQNSDLSYKERNSKSKRSLKSQEEYTNILGDIHFQTPINILSRNAKFLDKDKVRPLNFSGHWARDGQAWFQNGGKIAKLTFENRRVQPQLTGGLLNGRYIFNHMHFHWGEIDKAGSEHRLDGKPYSMEAHLVHINSKYANFTEAIKYVDGLAVAAFFIQADDKAYNVPFAKISNAIGNMKNPDTKTSVDSDSLLWVASQKLDSNYFTYLGSQTIGEFNEAVTWIVFKKPVIVSTKQVDQIKKNRKVVHNNRGIQRSQKPPTVVFVGEKCEQSTC